MSVPVIIDVNPINVSVRTVGIQGPPGIPGTGIDLSSYITTGQTGNFGGAGPTGQLTGAFYPLTGNPAYYLTSGQTGSFIFSTPIYSGLTQQFINFPFNLDNSPHVFCSLINTGNNGQNILVWPSGIVNSGYWAQFSWPVSGSSYNLITLATLSSQTGLATTVIIQSGGPYYPATSNPLNYISAGGDTATGQLTGVFYPLNTNPSGYITTGQTGNFTGSFYPLNSNPSGYVTTGQTGILTGTFSSLNSVNLFSNINTFSGVNSSGLFANGIGIWDSGYKRYVVLTCVSGILTVA